MAVPAPTQYDIVQSLVFEQSVQAVKATGTITFSDAGDNGDTITVPDANGDSIQFELDTADPPVAATGDKGVLIATYSDDTCDNLVEAISGSGLKVTAANNSTAAVATITIAGGAADDGDEVEITDYTGTTVIFEFDPAATIGGDGDVAVDPGASAAASATNLAAAIEASALDITVSDDLAGELTLTQGKAGIEGQVATDPNKDGTTGTNITIVVWGGASLTDGATIMGLTSDVAGTSGNGTVTETGDTFTVTGSLANGVDAEFEVGLLGHTETGAELVIHQRGNGQVEWESPQNSVRYVTQSEEVNQLFEDLAYAAGLTE